MGLQGQLYSVLITHIVLTTAARHGDHSSCWLGQMPPSLEEAAWNLGATVQPPSCCRLPRGITNLFDENVLVRRVRVSVARPRTAFRSRRDSTPLPQAMAASCAAAALDDRHGGRVSARWVISTL